MNGGIFDLMTPAKRQEIAIRKALEQRKRVWPRQPDEVYAGAGDLLLCHGRFFQGRELPDAYQHLFQLDGGQGNCFRNAWFAAKESGLPYYEGVYNFGAGHFTPHAWLVAPDGELLELTVDTKPELIARGIEARSSEKMLPVEHWGYWGIELHVDYVEAVSKAEGAYGGTLDRPIHDELFKDDPTQNVSDDRDRWPIYTYPYRANRREP